MKWYNTLLLAGVMSVLGYERIGAADISNKILDKKTNILDIRTMNNKKYSFGETRITEISTDTDNEALYGVISDSHGEFKKAKLFAREFKNMGVDGIIVPGDIALNKRLKYNKLDNNDSEEIIQVLEVIAETGLPVFVIPGNHERKKDYESALDELTNLYPNIIDMVKYRVFDGDDVDFVSLPGYQKFKTSKKQLIPDDGYFVNQEFINNTGKLTEGLDDSIILITHGAGKTNTNDKFGPSTTFSGKDFGDETTSEMMKKYNIPFAVAGHIHESGGYATTHEGKWIKQGKWAKQFSANFGGLERWLNNSGNTFNGMAGIIHIRGDKAKYETFTLE